jgi:hypothetical protein
MNLLTLREHETFAIGDIFSADGRKSVTHAQADALDTGVRQLNLIFREFLMDSPVFTRVPAAVFENQCGGTSCKKQAFIDANISADKVAACL